MISITATTSSIGWRCHPGRWWPVSHAPGNARSSIQVRQFVLNTRESVLSQTVEKRFRVFGRTEPCADRKRLVR